MTPAIPDRNEILDAHRHGKLHELMSLIASGTMSQVVAVGAQLRIPDLLASGPKAVHELAHATGSHAPSLRRLLRALASLDLCIEREDGSFGLTSMGDLLRTDAPNSIRSWTLWCCTHMWPVWGRLRSSVMTGESAQKFVFGADGFDHLQRDEDFALAFNKAMVDLTRIVAGELIHVYDFSGCRRLIDIGGGYGSLLLPILESHPGMQGVLFDLPHAIAGARAGLSKNISFGRCDLIAGDFFASVPSGGDIYVLKTIIHDWNDERSTVILRNCRRAIPCEGKLLLIEQIMPERIQACLHDQAVTRVDLVMLLGPGGRERTEAEFHALLAASGFKLVRILPTALAFSVLEAVPVGDS